MTAVRGLSRHRRHPLAGVLLVLIGLVAYPRLQKSSTGSIRVATSPGATVEVGGKVRGVAGADGILVVDGLEVGRGYRVNVRLPHHKPAETLAEPDDDAPTTVELAVVPEQATVTLVSDPPGAHVLDGDTELGNTPLTWTRFVPGSTVKLTLRQQGFGDEVVTVNVPAGGGEATVSRQLQVAAEAATIRVTSEPPGAAIFLDGQRQAGMATPSDEIFVESGKTLAVRLELDGYQPATVTVTPGRGARALPVAATLERAITLTVAANLEARVTVEDVRGCEKKPLPATCTLRKGRYEAKIETTKLPGKIVRPVVMADQDVKLDVVFGVVVAPAGHKLVIGGRDVDRAAFEVGKRVQVTIKDAEGVTAQVVVKPVAGKTVEAN